MILRVTQILAWLLSIVAVGLYSSATDLLARLCIEDGWLENSTALFYFLGSLCFLNHAKSSKFKPIVGCLGLALLFFVVAGEEISWGQRIFGFSSPESIEHLNVQQEVNLHNLAWLQDSYRIVGLFVILVLTFCIPLGVRISNFIKWGVHRLGIPLCPLSLNVIVGLGVAFMLVPRLLGLGPTELFELDEVGEFLLALALFSYAMRPESLESVGVT